MRMARYGTSDPKSTRRNKLMSPDSDTDSAVGAVED